MLRVVTSLPRIYQKAFVMIRPMAVPWRKPRIRE